MLNELSTFLSSFNLPLQFNAPNVIPFYKLSFFFPEQKVAIELYDHASHVEPKVGKQLHNEKAIKCLERGIKLIQFFEDEWLNRKDICKSMIMHRLGTSTRKIFARKCEVIKMPGNVSAEFFNKSHLAGGTQAKAHFGLQYEGEIVAALSLRAPVQKNKNAHLKEGILEIARFATLPYCHISGGFGKIFKVAKEWAKEEGYKKILSYADLRTGTGSLYEKNDFAYKGRTASCMYWYCQIYTPTNPEKYKDIIQSFRYFRFRFRAQKPLTEKQVAVEAGVERIYGTVNNTYEFSLDNVSQPAIV